MTREWAVAQENRVVWLSVHPRGKRERTLPEQWLRCVSLVEVLSGEADLAAILREQAGVERPRSSGNAALPIYTKARRYPPVYEPVAPAHPGRLFAVELRASEVRVNGLVVIPSNARTGRQIFKALYSSFLADLESGKQPDAFQALNAEALCRVFYDETGEGEADPDVVRKTVNRIQAKIEKIIKRETGMPIGRHDVIQTQRWKGIGEGEHGYRLNPNSVAIRPDQSQESAT